MILRPNGSITEFITDTLTMNQQPTWDDNGAPRGNETITNLKSLSRTITDSGGLVTDTEKYFSLGGLTYNVTRIPAPLGTNQDNFSTTQYAYDSCGQLCSVLQPSGTATCTVYDSLGRIRSWQGTDSTFNLNLALNPTKNSIGGMTKLTQNVYDNGGVGDGNLTEQITYVKGSGARKRVTDYFYDWRDRLVATKDGVSANERLRQPAHHLPAIRQPRGSRPPGTVSG